MPSKLTDVGGLPGGAVLRDFLSNFTDVDGALKLPASVAAPAGGVYETMPRWICGTNSTALTSGTVYLTAIWLPKGLTVTSISFLNGATAIVAGTHQQFGLYDSSRARLAVTNDDTSTAWAANSVKTLNLSAPFVTTYAGLYYIGYIVTAATPPTPMSRIGDAGANAVPPILVGSADTGVTALPANAAALTAIANMIYAYVA